MSTPIPDDGWGDALRRDGALALDWAARYLDGVADMPVLARTAPGDVRRALPPVMPDDPEPFAAILEDLDGLLPALTHWQHPRFFAYFATSAPPPGILAELLAATINQVAFLWRTSPVSTEMEAVTLGWVADLLGLPPGLHGHIEDTASTSTFAAMAAARHVTGRHVVVASEEAHSSVAKAARLLDMELRTVATDDAFRARADLVADALAAGDVAAVVATIGTTSTTSVDPVRRMGELAAAAGAWLHVDAAYAGSSWASPATRWSQDGLDLADSLVVNPHKWLFVPADCSCLWTRRPEDLRAAFSLVPEYLRTPDETENLSEYGPALGRRFRSIKLWAVLRCYGRSGIRAAIERAIDLAQGFAARVAAEPGWEICAPHPFSTVCFRPEGPDERSQAVLERVNAGGEIFISHTRLDGRHVLRLAIGHMRTGEADVERAWRVLRAAAAEVDAG